MNAKFCRVHIAAVASVLSAVSLSAVAAPTGDDAEAQARASWRDTMVRTVAPDDGCFYAGYPSTVWLKVGCTTAPDRPYMPRSGAIANTVGDGVDYVAQVTGLITNSIGTFPTVKGVRTERDEGQANVYSLQLNSNFMSGTAACDGISGCLSWLQFVYSSGEQSAFMQYWLINFGNHCPRGWNAFRPDCFKNSAAIAVPTIPIAQLSSLQMSGTAVKNGKDTLIFTTETEAFATTGRDSVVDLATAWNESEFNIIGDGGGSKATFNKGSSITVKIAVDDGAINPAACVANAGTTGETNNLTLGSCSPVAGPAIQFTESN